MTAPVLSLLSQWSEPALSWGIEVSPKALACGLLVYLVHLAVGRRRVLVRSALWNSALVGLVILPMAVVFSPRWNLAVWPAPPAPRPVETGLRISTIGDLEPPSAAIVLTEPVPELAAPSHTLPLILCGLYLLGVCVGLVRIARGLRGVALLRNDSAPVEAARWNEAFNRWRRQLGLTGAIELRQSESVSVPLVMGARKPVVIIPHALSTITDRSTIDAVLLHELAHVGRRDFAWNLLLKIVQTVYWFHPVGWCLGKMLHHVREDACDSVCIHWLGGPREYVGVLVELVVGYVPRPAAALGLGMTRTSRLSRRLRRLADGVGNARYALGRPYCGLGIAAMGAVVLGLASAHLTQQIVAEDRVVVPQQTVEGAANDEPTVREVELAEDVIDETKRKDDALDEEKKRLEAVRQRAREALEAVAANPGKKVAVVKVREGKLQRTTKQPCSLIGYEPLRIYPRLSGIVSKTVANVGDVVKKGQVLALIEVPDAEAQIAKAKAGVARAEADLTTAQVQLEASQAGIDTAKAVVDQSNADVARAEATLAYQTKQYDRMKNLAEQKAIDERLLDESEEKLSAAKADVKSTHAKIASSKALLVQAEADAKVKVAFVRAAEVDLAAAKEAFNVASMALLEDNRVVRAPADGIIAERDFDIGEAVGADRKPMFVLNSSSLIAARVAIPGNLVLKMKKGMSAVVTLDAEPGVRHEGTITQLAYNIDPKTRTLPATIAIPNPEGNLRPGMFGAAEIVMGETAMPVVPESAVLSVTKKQIDSWYCYKWTGSRFERVTVNRHHIPGNQWAISEGLEVGDEVALDAKKVFELQEQDSKPAER